MVNNIINKIQLKLNEAILLINHKTQKQWMS